MVTVDSGAGRSYWCGHYGSLWEPCYPVRPRSTEAWCSNRCRNQQEDCANDRYQWGCTVYSCEAVWEQFTTPRNLVRNNCRTRSPLHSSHSGCGYWTGCSRVGTCQSGYGRSERLGSWPWKGYRLSCYTSRRSVAETKSDSNRILEICSLNETKLDWVRYEPDSSFYTWQSETSNERVKYLYSSPRWMGWSTGVPVGTSWPVWWYQPVIIIRWFRLSSSTVHRSSWRGWVGRTLRSRSNFVERSYCWCEWRVQRRLGSL